MDLRSEPMRCRPRVLNRWLDFSRRRGQTIVTSHVRITLILGSVALIFGDGPCAAIERSPERIGEPGGEIETTSESDPIVPPVRRVAPRMPENKAKPKAAPDTAKAEPAPNPKKKSGN